MGSPKKKGNINVKEEKKQTFRFCFGKNSETIRKNIFFVVEVFPTFFFAFIAKQERKQLLKQSKTTKKEGSMDLKDPMTTPFALGFMSTEKKCFYRHRKKKGLETLCF